MKMAVDRRWRGIRSWKRIPSAVTWCCSMSISMARPGAGWAHHTRPGGVHWWRCCYSPETEYHRRPNVGGGLPPPTGIQGLPMNQPGNSSLSFIASIMSPSVRSLPPMKACMPSVEPSTMPSRVSLSMTRVTWASGFSPSCSSQVLSLTIREKFLVSSIRKPNTRSRPSAAPGLNLAFIAFTAWATSVMVRSFRVESSDLGVTVGRTSSEGDELRRLQQLQVGMPVEGSQCHLATAEFQLVERGVNNLPVQFEGLGGRHSGNQVEQGGDGAAGGEHGDFLCVVRGFKNALQATLDAFDKPQPAFEPRRVISAGQPALDDQGEDALEFAAVLRGITQDVQGVGFGGEQVGEQGADDCVGIEFVKGAVGFQDWNRQAKGAVLIEGSRGGVLLAAQVARQAAVEHQAHVRQVATEHLCLLHADGRQDVIVVCTEGGLAMSNQIDAAHVRFPGTLKVWRGYEDARELSIKKHTLVLKAHWRPCLLAV
ncbi:hypothetical protein ALP39_04861 [Pseudomonas marginalis pv. marginalis]|nr:hypothetical protein ALP39_04861 [Pseudomonas marginalis pv. marginalis]